MAQHYSTLELSSPAITVALFESVGINCASLDTGTGQCSPMSYLGDGNSQNGGFSNAHQALVTGPIGQPVRGYVYDTIFQTGRHTDGSNYLLADGHAKYLKGAAVSPGVFPKTTTCDQDQAGCQIFGAQLSTRPVRIW